MCLVGQSIFQRQEIAYPIAFYSIAFIAGSSRGIHYFPNASSGGLFLSATIAGGAVSLCHLHPTWKLHPVLSKMISIAISSFATQLAVHSLKGRVSLSFESNLRVNILFGFCSLFISSLFPYIDFNELATPAPEKAKYVSPGTPELTFYRDPINDQERQAMPHAKHTAFLGNFYPCTIRIMCGDGKIRTFRNAEAAYQSGKFPYNPQLIEAFTSLDGHQAWSFAQKNREKQDPNWKKSSLNWMETVVVAKFDQNVKLRELLLATQELQLTERTPKAGRDTFYGTNPDGTGVNHLGDLLIRVRTELRRDAIGESLLFQGNRTRHSDVASTSV